MTLFLSDHDINFHMYFCICCPFLNHHITIIDPKIMEKTSATWVALVARGLRWVQKPKFEKVRVEKDTRPVGDATPDGQLGSFR